MQPTVMQPTVMQAKVLQITVLQTTVMQTTLLRYSAALLFPPCTSAAIVAASTSAVFCAVCVGMVAWLLAQKYSSCSQTSCRTVMTSCRGEAADIKSSAQLTAHAMGVSHVYNKTYNGMSLCSGHLIQYGTPAGCCRELSRAASPDFSCLTTTTACGQVDNTSTPCAPLPSTVSVSKLCLCVHSCTLQMLGTRSK